MIGRPIADERIGCTPPVVAATVIVDGLGLATRGGVAVLGALPEGLPGLVLPRIGADDPVPVLLGGLSVALVSFADTSVLSLAFISIFLVRRAAHPIE